VNLSRIAFALVLLAGCVKDAPLPDLGACAEPPAGVYEYGQIGIGTCLSGPNDLLFLDGGRVLAVTNANPWKDFTGGSALFLDLSTVDWTKGRNVLQPAEGGEGVAARALDMPSFSGPMAYAQPHDTLVVANRLSEEGRTRAEIDNVWFVDVSDPDAPSFADLGPDGPTLPVGYDPVAVYYAASTDFAWVINRTAHTLGIIDLGASPAALVPPGGPTRLDPSDFVDVDASGSRAGFVTLDTVEVPEGVDPDRIAHTWNLDWSIGSLRLWVPSADGAYRVTGNGEALWERSAVPVDLDLADADGVVLAVNDPHFFLEAYDNNAYLSRVVFEDQGVLRAANSPFSGEVWDWESFALLEPSNSGWDTEIGGPSMLVEGPTWYLFYDGGDGGAHAVGLAISTDGETFTRADADPVFAIDGASVTDPFVLWDTQGARWRMYYTLDGASIGEATSEDLANWTVAGSWAPEGGAVAPAVAYVNGAYHLFYTTTGVDGDMLAEAVSLDGSTWEVLGAPFAVDEGAVLTGGVAIQASPEDAFVLTNEGGDTLALTLTPGSTASVPAAGWEVRVAVGQVADPATVDATGIALDSIHADRAFLTYTDDAGLTAIGTAEMLGGADLVLDASPVLEAGAGGDHDADGVSSAVVTEIGGEWVMYYAGLAGEVTTIGRATSADGLTWTADAAPLLTDPADWESVAMEPGSVQVLEDGTIRLWYTAFDGSRYRIGLAESLDDGVSFTRVPGTLGFDWMFEAGPPGDWYDSGVRHPYVVRDGDIDRMWFAGTGGTTWQIGYAERSGDTAEWESASTLEGTARPVLAAALGGFGLGGVTRPVAVPDGSGWSVWYTGLDGGGAEGEVAQGRVGRAVGSVPDRLYRDLRMPTDADTWSFTTVPARVGETLSLDLAVDGVSVAGGGCSALAEDTDRGFLYVGCKLVPYVYVIDIRDDSVGDFQDLNYLDVESILLVETSTGSSSGMRSLVVDRDRGWLWGVADTPEAIYAIDLAFVVDDADAEILREQVVSMLPLPRAVERDEGVSTESNVGPAQLAFHPDGRHLLVTNFNGNSVSAYDLDVGVGGTLVAQTEAVGENPYALRISPDGTIAAVANYAGEVDGANVGSTIALLDADPTSPTFLQVKTWLVNQ
jgi:predicted GH43/DUF377 family glycosyl hydrolase